MEALLLRILFIVELLIDGAFGFYWDLSLSHFLSLLVHGDQSIVPAATAFTMWNMQLTPLTFMYLNFSLYENVQLNKTAVSFSGFQKLPFHQNLRWNWLPDSINTQLQTFCMSFSIFLKFSLQNVSAWNEPSEVGKDLLSLLVYITLPMKRYLSNTRSPKHMCANKVSTLKHHNHAPPSSH